MAFKSKHLRSLPGRKLVLEKTLELLVNAWWIRSVKGHALQINLQALSLSAFLLITHKFIYHNKNNDKNLHVYPCRWFCGLCTRPPMSVSLPIEKGMVPTINLAIVEYDFPTSYNYKSSFYNRRFNCIAWLILSLFVFKRSERS